MFERLANGWELAKESLQVLKLDKELLLFPLLSGISCLLVMATFAVPLFFSGAHQAVFAEGKDAAQNVLMYVVLFAYYFVNYFVIVFFNCALVACAVIRLKGGDPTLRDGLQAATARLPQIAAWALVSATVGVILNAIESRSNRVGQVVTSLIGMAWSVTTFFVVPVLVIEEAGPIKAVQRSVAILKKTWGEALGANFGIGVITFVANLIGILIIGLGIAALAQQMAVIGAILIFLGVVYIMIVSLVASALNSIILAALYIFAAEGKLSSDFDASLLTHAFSHK